ncbi:MAG TPA: beta-ketoacyl synthase N-terminal-like domain-containing protein, partial [Candidatus Nanopelagicales bacterium]|nr:beta-ketoacyl synthase N-terminal-like domain-containing protein [Candidatus Nanopelagicales bacterium]
MGSLTVEQGHALLGRLLGSEATQIGAVPLDPSRWIESYPGLSSSPLFSALAQAPARRHDASGDTPRLRRAVMTTAPDERLRRLEQLVQEQAIKVLRVEPPRIRRTTNLLNLGVDSLLGLELRNRLEMELNLKLPSTLFWTYPRVDALAGHLLDLIGRPETSEPFGLPETSPDEGREPESPAYHPPAEEQRAPTAPAIASVEAPRAPPGQEPIAFIGVNGRYPKAPDLDAFWRNLCEGRNCLEEIPLSRWDAGAFARMQHEPGAPERGAGQWGGFLEDIESFDPGLFHLSPREALSMDPAERLALETAWRTFEDAGQGRAGADRPGVEKRVGVFIGCMYNHYPWLVDEALRQGTLFNNSYFAIANRISNFFDLRGPSLAIDTACSSSLVAIHMACESLRAGGCAMALAGGVNLTLHPYKYLALRQYNMLGSGGASRSLGQGDGMVPGEGVGMVLLKPLSAALREGDRIDAVLRSGAINHNGRGMGYTAPSPDAQAELLREALARAGLTADRLSYLELAANGSPLGDEAEIIALAQVFKAAAVTKPIPIGTVKSNIGHLEAASGISQLTKVLLQLRHRSLVPSINADPPNPHLRLEQTPFRIQESVSAWEAPEGERRRALITSLGGGGANACLVVEEHRAETPSLPAAEAPYLIAFSAPDAARLDTLLESFERYLMNARPDLRDLAFTLLTGRAALDARVAFT